jgi:hypothetical protein
MATTIINSMSVKPDWRWFRIRMLLGFLGCGRPEAEGWGSRLTAEVGWFWSELKPPIEEATLG